MNGRSKEIFNLGFNTLFLPKGIISRLIVRMHDHIENGIVWSEGVVFRVREAKAQIIEKITKKEGLKIIEIRLIGNPVERINLLTIIRNEIKRIQENSFPNLRYEEMIACFCSECRASNDPSFYFFSDLKRLVKKGKTTIECRVSGHDINIKKLVDSVGDNIVYRNQSEDINQLKQVEKQYTDLIDEIAKLQQLKKLCEETAKRKIESLRKNYRLAGLGLFLFIAVFIFILGWNVMEKMDFPGNRCSIRNFFIHCFKIQSNFHQWCSY